MNTILFVEDDSTFRETLTELLELEDYIVVQAANGAEALQLLGQIIPHLILCDVKMGKMTGIDFVMRVKQDSRLEQIPIIFISGDQDPKTLRQAKQAGVNEFVYKPILGDELLAKIRNLLSK